MSRRPPGTRRASEARRASETRRYRDAFAQRDLAHELEGMIDRAWTPLLVIDLGGWELRSARGFSRLANSVRPRALRGDQPLSARLAKVERFYATRGLPARFQISASAVPRGLDRALADQGYTATPPVEVRTTEIDTVAELAPADGRELTLVADPEPRWMSAWAGLTGAADTEVETVRGLLRRARVEAAYAVVSRNGADVAVARGVVHGGWFGLDYLLAGPDDRDGATGALLAGALGRWALTRDAARAYLHADAANPATSPLLAELRWRRSFEYRFREQRTLAPGIRQT
jgi:N-acetylglutamate synthase